MHCDMDAEATCLLPKPSASDEMAVVTQEREVWFSEMEAGGFSLSYKADSNQITFLQMLSSKASQDIIYHCSNSVAYHHAKRGNKRKAVTLMSWNDLEIRHRGKFSYRVPVDECQVTFEIYPSSLGGHNGQVVSSITLNCYVLLAFRPHISSI